MSISELYRETILDHYKHPRHYGKQEHASHTGKEDNTVCGDTVEFYFTIKDGRIQQVSWEGRGCALSQASASMLSELLIGKTTHEVQSLDDTVILSQYETELNPSRKRCATLCILAAKNAISEN